VLSPIEVMEYCKTKRTPAQQKKLREMISAGPMMKGREMNIKKGGSDVVDDWTIAVILIIFIATGVGDRIYDG